MMILISILLTILSYTRCEATTAPSCSCSPRAFLFKLNLATGFCPQIYPAKAIFGDGIKDYTCRISLSPNSEGESRTIRTNEAVVNSIQFIEIDTQFNVLHTSLVKDVELVTGDSFRYTTLQQQDQIAGGISIILRGKNAVGDTTENVFTVTYTNECGVRTFKGGEKIGWVTIENLIPASARTCDEPAEFNAVPSQGVSSTTDAPTLKPSASVPSPPSGDGGVVERTPDVILMEILHLIHAEKEEELFADVRISPGVVFLIEQALASYHDSLIFDAIYRTTDASKLLACDESDDYHADVGASKVQICDLLSEALCGLAEEIGGTSIEDGVVSSPTFHPSSGATTVVGSVLSSPPTTATRPV